MNYACAERKCFPVEGLLGGASRRSSRENFSARARSNAEKFFFSGCAGTWCVILGTRSAALAATLAAAFLRVFGSNTETTCRVLTARGEHKRAFVFGQRGHQLSGWRNPGTTIARLRRQTPVAVTVPTTHGRVIGFIARRYERVSRE